MPNTGPILCVHRGGTGDNTMYWCRGDVQPDGSIAWSGDTRFTIGGQLQTCAEGVSLAIFRDRIFCVWKEATSASLRFAYWHKGLQTWAPVQSGNTTSDSTPGLVTVNNQLFCVFQGEGSYDMYFARCTDWVETKTMPPGLIPNWSGGVFSNRNQMCAGVGVVDYKGSATSASQLFAIHRQPPTGFKQKYPFMLYSRWNGTNWSDDLTWTDVVSSAGPGVACFNYKLFVVRRGTQSDTFNDRDIYTNRYEDTGGALKQIGSEYRSGNQCEVGPSLVICNDNLYCVHRGGGDDELLKWARWRSDNNTWEQDQNFSGNRSAYEVGLVAAGNLL